MRQQIDSLLREALRKLAELEGLEELVAADPQIERTRDTRHGDFTSNVAMRLAKQLGRPPRDLANALIAELPAVPVVASVEIAGPGFINFRLAAAAYHDELRDILSSGPRYGCNDLGGGRRVLLEYLSANPTGPLHVGHGRLAAYGATLANLLRACGYDVDEEYYVNDAGRQMDILAVSVWLRYAEATSAELSFPRNCYQGAYVRDIAAALANAHGDRLLGDPEAIASTLQAAPDDAEVALDELIASVKQTLGAERFIIVYEAALDSVLGDIKEDLDEFSVVPGRWFSERSLTASSAVDHALAALAPRLYEQDGATWFRSTEFGDDKDRVVVRENGARTYFASDIAYHREKCLRGYDLLLNVLGADHHGYVARLRASLAAFGSDPDMLEVRLVQFVVLYRGEVKAQMSTRSGEYITLRELRNEVGNDAARFFYVSRSNDQHLDFDLDLAKSQSNDNPVYYVQYAHARVASMMQKLNEQGFERADDADLTALTESAEIELVAGLSRYPEVVALAAENRAPQHVVHYLRDMAGLFHSYYNAHRVLVDDARLRAARVALALAVGHVIRNGLGLLGVSAPEAM